MLYAFALEYGARVVSIPLWSLVKSFPYIEDDGVIKVSTGSIDLDRLLKRFLVLFTSRRLDRIAEKHWLLFRYQQIDECVEKGFFNLRDRDFIECAISGIVSVYGWFYEDLASWRIHKERVRSVFQLHADLLAVAKTTLALMRQRGPVVGVHIRRGDYKTAYSGRYYYGLDEWSDIIISVFDQYMTVGLNPVFLVCSDERVCLQLPDSIQVKYSDENEYVDIALLSGCDLLLGVMSTFVCWASFLGKVPLLLINVDHMPDISDARICAGYIPNTPLWE